ncbi:MAG: ABC transporter substrate-binding protein [Desulfonatronovibrionaceae bacterium]
MKKTAFMLSILIFFAVFSSARAEDLFRVSVSQFVEHPALDAVLKGFKDVLQEAGLHVDYSVHNAQANTAVTAQIAQQITGEKPDLVLAIATPSAQACAQATKQSPRMAETPLLFSAITDPVGAGLVDNLDRPGKNITGTSDLTPVDKHVQLIKDIHPDMTTLGVLYNSGEANSKTLARLAREACAEMGLEVQEATAARSSEVYQAAKSLVGRSDAVYVPTDNTIVSAFESVAKICSENDLPLYAADVDSVPRGAIAALGFDYYEHGRQTGQMAVEILKNGADPAEMPVQLQKNLKLHINLDAARKMNVQLPQDLVDSAARVYE